MDALLGGYGSDSSTSSNDRGGNPLVSTTAPPPPPLISITNPSASSTSSRQRRGRGGKRLLSLGAILPPEIFDRLTRTSQENGDDDDDSSASVSSGDGRTTARYSKRDMQQKQQSGGETAAVSDKPAGRLGGDKDLTLLLNELRSKPVTSSNAVVSSRKNNSRQEVVEKDTTQEEFLGMAFMDYTSSSSTRIGGNRDKTVVVDVHATPTVSVATPMSPPQFRRAIQSAPPSRINNDTSIDQPAVDDNDNRSDKSINYIPNIHNDSNNHISNNNTNRPGPDNSGSGVMYKSRKQLREEEQSLRSGHIAFDNYSADVYQPSPTEFAPTAHAAAIASKAARRIAGSSGGGGGHSSIAMYDPKQGMEVSGLGVTGKHRSKHQINQLMASAISLEAHRASEAELARFGAGAGGKGNSRTDAKRKYGW